MLSDKEWHVAIFIIQGYSEKRIAQKLNRSLRTVKFHKTNIFQKTQCNNTDDFTRFAYSQGWQFYLPTGVVSPMYIIKTPSR
ncbi:helix-turn-helix transcriptional regulator [Serratia sp. NPDC078593]|uniref:helix-turn-helix transcriptional regulator n=1 Tax=unclassified Serratia (in: enterobacteria) TaxID=2647522 RepID=UPI0037D4AECD